MERLSKAKSEKKTPRGIQSTNMVVSNWHAREEEERGKRRNEGIRKRKERNENSKTQVLEP